MSLDSFTLQQTIPTPTPGTSVLYGQKIAVSGNGKVAMISALNALGSFGLVYVFTTEDNWKTFTQRVTLETVGEETAFGQHLQLSADGTRAVISTTSAFYVYDSFDNWSTVPVPYLIHTVEQGDFYFNPISLSANGNLLAVCLTTGPSTGFVVLYAYTTGFGNRNRFPFCLFIQKWYSSGCGRRNCIEYYDAGTIQNWPIQRSGIIILSNSETASLFGSGLSCSLDGETQIIAAFQSDLGTSEIVIITSQDGFQTEPIYTQPIVDEQNSLNRNAFAINEPGNVLVITYRSQNQIPGIAEVYTTTDTWQTRMLSQTITMNSMFNPFAISFPASNLLFLTNLDIATLVYSKFQEPPGPLPVRIEVDRGIVAGPPRDAAFQNVTILTSSESGKPAQDAHFSALQIGVDWSSGWVPRDRSWSNLTFQL